MQHMFDIQLACQLGVNASIIYKNICFWCEKNKANDKNFHKGRHWTYNSINAFKKLFPYMSEHDIKKALVLLKEQNLIVVDCFNENPYDHTKWYSIVENRAESEYLPISENSPIDIKKITNRYEKNNQSTSKKSPIINNETDNKPNIKTADSKDVRACVSDSEVLKEENSNPFQNGNSSDSILDFPLADGSIYFLTQEKLEEYSNFFDGVKVKQALLKCVKYLNAKPEKRKKTPDELEKYLCYWLEKEPIFQERIEREKNQISNNSSTSNALDTIDFTRKISQEMPKFTGKFNASRQQALMHEVLMELQNNE